MIQKLLIKLILSAGTALVSTVAHAAVVVTVAESGPNVVASALGTLNLNGTTREPSTYIVGQEGGFAPDFAIAYFGGDGVKLSRGYLFSNSGPTNFGTGSGTNASFKSGDRFEFRADQNIIYVDDDFISGSNITSYMSFANATLTSLGLNVGEYVYTLPNDTVTINITRSAIAAVPEVPTWAMMIGGFGFIGGALRRQRLRSIVRFT